MKGQISQADTCANDEMLLSVLLLRQYEVSWSVLSDSMRFD